MFVSRIPAVLAYSAALALCAGAPSAFAGSVGLTSIEELGNKIFFDKNLSIRRNLACSSCHAPKAGWVGADSLINEHGAVYEGSIRGEFGNRKPPSSAYATLAPIFYADYGNRLLGDNLVELATDPLFVGGNFWDGRATGWELRNPAADQAQGPFLNPVEQALPDAACVVYRVCEGRYGDLFDEVWGAGVCMIAWPSDREVNEACSTTDGQVALTDPDRAKVDRAYDRVALSIAAFEASKASNAFTSKLDARRAGLYEFTDQEELGRQIFLGKGNCVACHVGNAGPGAPPPLFTDFTYDNLGVPKNPENPYLEDNPEWRDPGLAGFLATVSDFERYADANKGKQKVPTLRNVGLGSCEALEYDDADEDFRNSDRSCIVKAYTHNGFFKSLWSVVHFYNTRDTKPSCESLDIFDATEAVALANDCWPVPEVAENVNRGEVGDLGLSDDEEMALVAFLLTLSDGYEEDD